MAKKFRVESDTLGEVKIPENSLWGPQTQRSINNFKIGQPGSMPKEIIHSFAILKKSCAISNNELMNLEKKKMKLIIEVCDEILKNKHNKEFPLVIWQTGSGTQTNMNINEVISNRANILSGKSLIDSKYIKANDEINMSQSSNDTFPTVTNIAVTKLIYEKLIPSTESFIKILNKKVKEFSNDIKIGRTHMMDATPISLGQEFSGYESQMKHGLKALKNTLKHLKQLAIGGTAVGTGLNAPDGFDVSVVKNISDYTKINFEIAENKFEAIASNDALVETHGALKQIAVSLFKIANDIRLLGSGPRSGFAELILPANEPGSSIMPGKVNPTQCEAVSMVCTQVLGNDTTVSFAGSQGHLELNVYKPVIAHKLIESIHLLSDSMESFNKNCLSGLKANKTKIAEHLNNSLMLVTALNKKIGYYKAAEIANKAHENGTTLEEEAIKSGYLTKKQFKDWVNPEDMV
ncbi:MAG: fumarate hydratase class II [Flavobacteriaceae bacterium]|nr:MAG: fumarate hydratase class II [Flavobacteriaceae bacterium]